MDQRKRRRGRPLGLGARGEPVVIVGLASLAVIQGSAAAWGIMAGLVEMFRLLLGL